MTPLKLIIPGLLILLLAGCPGPDAYPISGEACAPTDPVHDLSTTPACPPA